MKNKKGAKRKQKKQKTNKEIYIYIYTHIVAAVEAVVSTNICLKKSLHRLSEKIRLRIESD